MTGKLNLRKVAGALLAIVWKREPALVKAAGRFFYGAALAAAVLLCGFSRYPSFRTGSNTVIGNGLIYSLVVVLVSAVLGIGQRPRCGGGVHELSSGPIPPHLVCKQCRPLQGSVINQG